MLIPLSCTSSAGAGKQSPPVLEEARVADRPKKSEPKTGKEDSSHEEGEFSQENGELINGSSIRNKFNQDANKDPNSDDCTNRSKLKSKHVSMNVHAIVLVHVGLIGHNNHLWIFNEQEPSLKSQEEPKC